MELCWINTSKFTPKWQLVEIGRTTGRSSLIQEFEKVGPYGEHEHIPRYPKLCPSGVQVQSPWLRDLNPEAERIFKEMIEFCDENILFFY